VEELIKNCGNELITAPYIQSAKNMLEQNNQFLIIENNMRQIMDNFESDGR
jgi:hypothetical protein